MAWKQILVHCRAYSDTSHTLDVAIGLAREHGARLTGLYTLRELAMLKLMFGASHPTAREAEARDAPLTAEAEVKFRDACAKASVPCDWAVGEGVTTELISWSGRVHDLVVVGQSPISLDGLGADFVEESTVACGSPVIIVPKGGSGPQVGKNVVVAWNHSRQSATALQAALPMIERADKVTILVGQERDAMSSVTKRPKHDIQDYVRRHAPRAIVTAMPISAENNEAGRALLKAVRDSRSDILVMGAYGRPRWREFLFGGATKDVISMLDVPVLMAH